MHPCVALLEEAEPTQVAALQALAQCVDTDWPEITDAIPVIEGLAETDGFAGRALAARICSKCFFYLEEYDEALRLALGCDDDSASFDFSSQSEYTRTLLRCCVDAYVERRTAAASPENDTAASTFNAEHAARIEGIVERMINKCNVDGAYLQAVGMCIETSRFDRLKESVLACPEAARPALLKYIADTAARSVVDRDTRLGVFGALKWLHNHAVSPDAAAVCRAMHELGESDEFAAVLFGLACGGVDASCMYALQIALDLDATEDHAFMLRVRAAVAARVAAAAAGALKTPAETAAFEAAAGTLATLDSVLDASNFGATLRLSLTSQNNKTDPLVLKNLKAAVDSRSGLLQSAVVVAHAYLNVGTTQTTFLRENMEWMAKVRSLSRPPRPHPHSPPSLPSADQLGEVLGHRHHRRRAHGPRRGEHEPPPAVPPARRRAGEPLLGGRGAVRPRHDPLEPGRRGRRRHHRVPR